MRFREHDHFSGHAAEYARHRPRYPDRLFAELAGLAVGHDLAWDCATGSGQAAGGLARHFRRVVATDASPQQLGAAGGPANVCFALAAAEAAVLPAGSVDLVTVAQALHWFDLAGFYAEVRRVAAPGAVLAAWCYDRIRVTPAVDAVIEQLYWEIVGPYWPAQRALVESGYATLEFPFVPLRVPPCEMVASWNLKELVGYLETWSAARRYLEARGESPLREVGKALGDAWGAPTEVREVRWPVMVRVGRV